MSNKKNLANGLLELGVSDTDTTWVLKNGYGAGMPDVPFYLTATPFGQLSTMGNSEIVNVTARSGDTLTVQRGAKGTTAKAFAAGAVVSNGIYADEKWTSENIDFTASSGSNANGSWIQFSDGTMICYADNLAEATTRESSGSIYFTPNIPVTFPKAFISPPIVQVSAAWSSWRPFAGFAAGISTTDCTVRLAGSTSTSRGYPRVVMIGRWK